MSDLNSFSIEEGTIDLPPGAFAKTSRQMILWKGRLLAGLSQGLFRSYLFPVYTPAGQALTSESPGDHPHHNSLWVGADHVHCRMPLGQEQFEESTYNFYVNEVFQGRAPGRIVQDSFSCTELNGAHLRIKQDLHWVGPAEWGAPEGRTVLKETRQMDFRPGERGNLIDVQSRLCPTEWAVRVGPTRHAYFGLRLCDRLHAARGAQLTDSAGRCGAVQISGAVSDWVDCSGEIADGTLAGAALFPYPSAAGHPWFVTDWGLLTVNPLKERGWDLEVGQGLEFAARFVIHDGDARKAGVDELFDQFQEECRSH